MACHEAAQLGCPARQRVPLGLAHDDVGLAELPETTDMVLVEMGEDRRVDVAGGISEPAQPGAQGLFRG